MLGIKEIFVVGNLDDLSTRKMLSYRLGSRVVGDGSFDIDDHETSISVSLLLQVSAYIITSWSSVRTESLSIACLTHLDLKGEAQSFLSTFH